MDNSDFANVVVNIDDKNLLKQFYDNAIKNSLFKKSTETIHDIEHKCEYFFNDKNYLFCHTSELHNTKENKCLIVVLNNQLQMFSEKAVIIELIFRLYENSHCKSMYVLTLYPKPRIVKIVSKYSFVYFMSTISYTYTQNSFLTVINQTNEEIYQIIHKEKYIENTKIILTTVIDKTGSVKLADDILKISNESNIIKDSNHTIEINENSFDVLECKQINNNFENFTLSNDCINDLIYNLYGLFIISYNKEITSDDVIKSLKIINYFSQIIGHKIFKDNKLSYLNVFLGFFNELIHYCNIVSMYNTSKFNTYLNKLSLAHITCNKYKKMIKSTKISCSLEIQNKIDHAFNKIYDKIQNTSSNEYFVTNVSGTNWKDEVIKKSCIGLEIDVLIDGHNRTGKYIDDVIFVNISSNFCSVIDFLNKLNSEKSFTGNPTSVEKMNNLILPLYVNDLHWKIAKEYCPILLSLCFSNNTEMYDTHMLNIYYIASVNYFMKAILEQNIIEKKRLIKIWISLFRTCAEISFEHRYHKGIKTHIQKMLCSQNNDVQLIVLAGQMMSTGYYDYGSFIKLVNKYFTNEKHINTFTKKTLMFGLAGIQIIQILAKVTNGGFPALLKQISNSDEILSEELENIILENTPTIIETCAKT